MPLDCHQSARFELSGVRANEGFEQPSDFWPFQALDPQSYGGGDRATRQSDQGVKVGVESDGNGTVLNAPVENLRIVGRREPDLRGVNDVEPRFAKYRRGTKRHALIEEELHDMDGTSTVSSASIAAA